MGKYCKIEKNFLTLQRFRETWAQGLSYGVMVALQFLVLPVLVRIQVRQHKERGHIHRVTSFFMLCVYSYLLYLK